MDEYLFKGNMKILECNKKNFTKVCCLGPSLGVGWLGGEKGQAVEAEGPVGIWVG